MKLPNRTIIALATASALALSSVSLAADNDKILATVNGKSITQKDYDRYLLMNRSNSAASAGTINDKALNELISRELIYQDAVKKGLDKKPLIQEQVELFKDNLIINAALSEALKERPVSEDELKRMYASKTGNFDLKEYKASHILLKEKSDAEKVISELDKGADFAELAKEKSVGPTGKNGGDLGWFAPQQMAPEFGKEIVSLEKGRYSKEPVQTKFGWHVIKVEDIRQAEPPSFDSIKGKLRKFVEQQRAAEYIRGLVEKAKVEVK